jgi:hypothetical protein
MRFRTRGTRRLAMMLALMGGVAFVVGCSAVLGIESDRHLFQAIEAGDDTGVPDGDTGDTSIVDAAPSRWACLSDPVPAPASDTIQLKWFFSDVSSAKNGVGGKPIVGAEIHACTKLDITCGIEAGLPGSGGTTDDAGIVNVSVPGAFDGYYEVHANNFTPGILSRSEALSNESVNQGMADINLLGASASLAGLTQDPDLAIAIVSAADCVSGIADGVVIEVGSPAPNESVVYFVNSLPSKSATETDKQTGSAIIFNVPPGTLTVSAKVASNQSPIRTVSALTRKDWITFVQIRPDQAVPTPL